MPGRISILMHQEAAKLILEIHPEIKEIYVEPLRSMAEILYKAGFADSTDYNISEDLSARYEWNYDYRATGVPIKDLYSYFVELYNSKATTIGLDLEDFTKSDLQDLLQICNKYQIPVSKNLLTRIASKLELKN